MSKKKRIIDFNRRYRYYSNERNLFCFLTPTVRLVEKLKGNQVRVRIEDSNTTFTCSLDQLVILPTEEQVIVKQIKRYLKQPFLLTRDMFEHRWTVSVEGGREITGNNQQIAYQLRIGIYQQSLHFPTI